MVLCPCRDRVYPCPYHPVKAGQPKGCPYTVVCLCRDRVYPVRGYEGRVVYAERVYIWVVGPTKGRLRHPDPDTTSPPQADFPLSAQKAGHPQGVSLHGLVPV